MQDNWNISSRHWGNGAAAVGLWQCRRVSTQLCRVAADL